MQSFYSSASIRIEVEVEPCRSHYSINGTQPAAPDWTDKWIATQLKEDEGRTEHLSLNPPNLRICFLLPIVVFGPVAMMFDFLSWSWSNSSAENLSPPIVRPVLTVC